MSRVVPVRITDVILKEIDDCAKRTKSCRSSFVRDACLHYLKVMGNENVSFVKISRVNSEKLKLFASRFNVDHDVFLDEILEAVFEKGDDAWGKIRAGEPLD